MGTLLDTTGLSAGPCALPAAFLVSFLWLPQQNYVLEQKPTDTSPRRVSLSPTASASELTNIITLLIITILISHNIHQTS